MAYVTDAAYVAVLENKLVQAERNLYEFRQIFTHWQSSRGNVQEVEGAQSLRMAKEDRDYSNSVYPEAECLE